MKLHFVDMVSARDAKASCFGEKGGRIITSHEGCNKEGERAVYKVNDVTVSADEHSLELSVEQSTWKDAFKRFDIDFGYTNDDHLYRRHSDFAKVRRRRQASNPTVSAELIAIPTGTPEDVTSQSFDISSQLIDSTFKLPDFVNLLNPLIPLPSIPIDLKCKNCTTTGTLVLTQGAINIDLTNVADLNPDTSVISGGFFELAANDMSAHIELVAKPIVSDTFSVTLPGLPILGFVIPGIGEAGVTFNQTLTASYDVPKSIEVTYGFDVVVPSPSTIKVELTDFTKSGIVGFPDSKLTPLPFSANVSEINILLSAAYLPSIPIGFKFLDQLDAGVTISMELPRLDLRLSNRGANCDSIAPPTAANATNTTSLSPNDPSAALPGILAELASLVLVEANVSISLDVGAKFSFPLLPDGLDSFATAANIFETTFQLLTSCLDPKNGFAPATQLAVSETATYIASTIVAASSTACATSTVTVIIPYGGTAPPAPSATSVAVPSSVLQVDEPAPTSSIIEQGGYAPPSNGTVQTTVAPSGTGGYTVPSATAPQQFTGAASPGIFTPALNWSGAGWQAAVLGVSFVAGIMVLL
ncbi:hypothetical protein K505DRAFT_257392 [Melanomma pulvis-pyrius CBS 109.77]|uniref:GPI anchored protein n=1 Tax=Melanomma pulvis-pyrius CBS 109.77 TaxID=1314802 RepID=A0A6A6WUG0_9PLEO|nr:hypothetical protein K505DRAFT_257392 [Melanomma pulvis-pyrius CBS 109.77]